MENNISLDRNQRKEAQTSENNMLCNVPNKPLSAEAQKEIEKILEIS